MVAVFGPLLLVEGSVYIWMRAYPAEGETPAADEQQPCRLKLARGLLLAESSRLVVAVANAGTCTDVQRSPAVAATDRIAADPCSLAGRERSAKREHQSERAAHAVFCLPRRPGVLPPPVGQSAQNSLLSQSGRVRAHNSSPSQETEVCVLQVF
jgi:hypothetical protein